MAGKSILKGKRVEREAALIIAAPFVEELDLGGWVQKIEVAGMIRRRCAAVDGMDIVAVLNNEMMFRELWEAWSFITEKSIWRNEYSGILSEIRITVYSVDKESFGASLLWWTGDEIHIRGLQKRARDRGYALTEFGLFDLKSEERVAETEPEIYRRLGMDFVKPENRFAYVAE